jgi:hypothetical protein
VIVDAVFDDAFADPGRDDECWDADTKSVEFEDTLVVFEGPSVVFGVAWWSCTRGWNIFIMLNRMNVRKL